MRFLEDTVICIGLASVGLWVMTWFGVPPSPEGFTFPWLGGMFGMWLGRRHAMKKRRRE